MVQMAFKYFQEMEKYREMLEKENQINKNQIKRLKQSYKDNGWNLATIVLMGAP